MPKFYTKRNDNNDLMKKLGKNLLNIQEVLSNKEVNEDNEINNIFEGIEEDKNEIKKGQDIAGKNEELKIDKGTICEKKKKNSHEENITNDQLIQILESI